MEPTLPREGRDVKRAMKRFRSGLLCLTRRSMRATLMTRRILTSMPMSTLPLAAMSKMLTRTMEKSNRFQFL